MNITGNKHLSLADRSLIESSLKSNLSCKAIADNLDVDPRTVSREVKRNRNFVPNGRYGSYGSFDNAHCDRLDRFPFVCDGCIHRKSCRKKFFVKYVAKDADAKYRELLVSSRSGISVSKDEYIAINNTLEEGYKKGKSIHNMLATDTSIPVSEATLYRWVREGRTSLCMVDLIRIFKPRKKHYANKEDNRTVRIGRKYVDFLELMRNNPFSNIVQMDTVESTRNGQHKCLLTLHFVGIHFMLIFLLDHKNKDCVSNVFKWLQGTLGLEEYKKLFPIILTDRGSEFADPLPIEFFFETGEQVSRLFYCDSYASYQKGHIECNHRYIRQIVPKGVIFDDLTQSQVDLMSSHINSTYRESIEDTPIAQFKRLYGECILTKLNVTEISPDKVTLNKTILK